MKAIEGIIVAFFSSLFTYHAVKALKGHYEFTDSINGFLDFTLFMFIFVAIYVVLEISLIKLGLFRGSGAKNVSR